MSGRRGVVQGGAMSSGRVASQASASNTGAAETMLLPFRLHII